MAKRGRGQPTKYKAEYCDMIVDHFRIEPMITKKRTEYFHDGSIKSESEYPVANMLPTFQSFADKIGVNIDTLHEWKKKHIEFSESYAHAKELQEHIWLVNSMANLYNSQFAQFFGKNCLGYKDRQEIESKNINIDTDITGMTKEEIEAELEKMGFKKE